MVGFTDEHGDLGASRLAFRHSKLLIVEPVRLLRWSLMRYLSKWFDVTAVATTQEALQILAGVKVYAIIVSDALPDDGAQQLEMRAKHMEKCCRIVRMVAQPVTEIMQDQLVQHIEKPFELCDIRNILLQELPLPD